MGSRYALAYLTGFLGRVRLCQNSAYLEAITFFFRDLVVMRKFYLLYELVRAAGPSKIRPCGRSGRTDAAARGPCLPVGASQQATGGRTDAQTARWHLPMIVASRARWDGRRPAV